MLYSTASSTVVSTSRLCTWESCRYYILEACRYFQTVREHPLVCSSTSSSSVPIKGTSYILHCSVTTLNYTAKAARQALRQPLKITNRPTLSSLWHLKTFLIESLYKIRHPQHDAEGSALYLHTTQEQTLISVTPWTDPPDWGNYFTPSLVALNDCLVSIKESQLRADKSLCDTFEHAKLVLIQISKECIPVAYHTGAT